MTNTENNLSLEELRERIDYLSSFLLESRIDTLTRALDMRTEYITVMTENMFHAQNASAIVRHCEAFGVQNIHTVEELCPFLPTLNIALGTDKWIDISARVTFPNPFFLMENESFLAMMSSPRKRLIIHFLDAATGRSAAVLRPNRPSESQSVASPLAKAINMQAMVDTCVGIHRTIAGSSVSMMYGPRLL